MLSILIPTKDYNCSTLIEELHKQGEALGCPYEILVAEDGTDKSKLHLNAISDTLANCRRIVKDIKNLFINTEVQFAKHII